MEALKQAVEKARRERENGAAPPGPSVTRKPTGAAPRRTDAPIHYTHTRRIQISAAELEKHRIFINSTTDGVSHAYKVLRTQVRQRMTQGGWNTLAVTSSGEHEGKSVTAINLAIGLARDINHTVLLGDLDLRRPGIHRYFGFEPEKGLSDYLLEGCNAAEILVNPDIDRLVLLPGREAIEHSSEALSSPRMVALMNELKHRYPERFIVLDLPPLLSADDVVAFAPYVDACLLVVGAGETKKEDVARAMQLLERTNVIGTVLNKARESGRSYYY